MPRWAGGALLALATALLVCGAILWWPRTVDDAYIIFQYARNLTEGQGAVYNPGERVEGYSSPSWMGLMAALIAAGVDPVAASKWLGLAASVALLVLVYRSLERSGTPAWGAGLATVPLGASFVLQIWSVSGMETTAYALLFFAGLAQITGREASVGRSLCASLLLACAALTRPEGLPFWLLAAVPLVAGPGREMLWRRLAAYAAPGLVLAGHFAWRLAYYGVPWPNTYYAKTGGGLRMWRQGLHGLTDFLKEPAHAVWIAAAAAGLLAGVAGRGRGRRAAAIMGLAVLLHLLFVVSVGDDGLFVHRFYAAIAGPLAFLCGQLFSSERAGSRLARTLAGAGLLAVAAATLLSVQTFHARLMPVLREVALPYLEGNIKLGRQLAATRAPGTLIAVASAGAITYEARLPTIDMYGLTDGRIAHGPYPARAPGRLMKWDNAYVLSRRPELIVINRGYFRAGDPQADAVLRQPLLLVDAPMDLDLFDRVIRDKGYALLAIPFPDGSRYYVFERKLR